jgi:hypothetical protein
MCSSGLKNGLSAAALSRCAEFAAGSSQRFESWPAGKASNFRRQLHTLQGRQQTLRLAAWQHPPWAGGAEWHAPPWQPSSPGPRQACRHCRAERRRRAAWRPAAACPHRADRDLSRQLLGCSIAVSRETGSAVRLVCLKHPSLTLQRDTQYDKRYKQVIKALRFDIGTRPCWQQHDRCWLRWLASHRSQWCEFC